MSRVRRLIPGVDTLEGKVLMTSGLIDAQDETLVAVTTYSVLGVAPQTNVISGTYTTGSALPDTGTTYQLAGSGTFRKLGDVSVSGSFSTPGFIRSNRITGTITIMGAGENDRLTLSVVSNQNPATHPSGSLFYFKTQSATGKFRNLVSSGKLHMTLGPGTATTGLQAASDDPLLVVIGGPASQTTGAFSLRITRTKA